MILKIAWRNIWRSKLRSSIVIIAIALGIWAGVFLMGFSQGMNNQRIRDALESTMGHIQVQSAEFNRESITANWLHETQSLEAVLDTSDAIRGYSERVILTGMISSAKTASGGRIAGIDEHAERTASNIADKMVDGTWFGDERKNQIVIGQKLAEKHKVKLKSKLVLSFQDAEGTIQTGLFRVGGIFKSNNSKWDEMNVFVRSRDLFRIFGMAEPQYHEVVVLLKDVEKCDQVAAMLRESNQTDEVRTWKQISPDLAYADQMMAQYVFIFMGIIMMALMFGIINNMLMAILERKRELGMLMAIGFNKVKLFSMIMIETVLLGLVGGPAGILMGWISIKIFAYKGLNLSMVGEGLESFGMAKIIYPEFDPQYYLIIGFMVVMSAILASIYPAFKALKLNPVETLRTAA